jgi:hypothetical protein
VRRYSLRLPSCWLTNPKSTNSHGKSGSTRPPQSTRPSPPPPRPPLTPSPRHPQQACLASTATILIATTTIVRDPMRAPSYSWKLALPGFPRAKAKYTVQNALHVLAAFHGRERSVLVELGSRRPLPFSVRVWTGNSVRKTHFRR